MKNRLIVIVILIAGGLTSCKKEDISHNNESASFLKIMNVDQPYLAKDVLEYPDGSVVLTGIGMIIGEFSLQFTPASPLPAIMTKYEANGNLQWQIELPEVVQAMWQCILLHNGNIAVVGFNSESDSKQIGIAIISPGGQTLAQNSFFNTGNIISSLSGGYSVNFTELSNGNIALAMPSSQATNLPLMPRLVIFNQDLNVVYDHFYAPDAVIKRRHCVQINIEETPSGDLLLHGRDLGFSSDTLRYFAFNIKLQSGTYSPIYHQVFETPDRMSPSAFAVAATGSAVWSSSGPLPKDTLFNAWFNLRAQEIFLIGPSFTVWMTDGNNANTKKMTISGYPKNGFINKVRKCKDGGYILIGTCNINTNQQVPSEYQLLLVKITAALQIEWMQFPKTSNPSIGSDIKETDTGYLVGATHLSLGEANKPILFKTDKQGIIN